MRKDDEEPSRIMVLVSLFLVRGPLGLPLVWKSGRFDRREKVVLTVAVTVYTVGLILAFYLAARAILRAARV
jgi:hypothetical protein